MQSTQYNQLSNNQDCKSRLLSAVHSMTDLNSHLLTHIYFTFGTLVRTYDSHNANIQRYVFDVSIPLHLQYHLTLTTLACPKRPLTLPPLTRRPRLAKHLSLRLKSTPLTRLPRLDAFCRTPHSASIAEHVEFMLVSDTPNTPQADAYTTKNSMQPSSVMKEVFPATLMWDNIVSHLQCST